MKFLLFLWCIQVESADTGVIWSMSAASKWFKEERTLSNRAAERNSTVISTYVSYFACSLIICIPILILSKTLQFSSISLESRLFLVGSSLNGFGTRSSDGDLCLVVKEEPVSNETFILSVFFMLSHLRNFI